jgi:hypothetical protein
LGPMEQFFHSFYSQWMPWKKVEAKSNIYFFPGCWWNSWLNLLLSQGALKMCGCNDGAGKPVLLVSYNDNIVRLYDLPTYEFQHTILKLVLKTLFLGGGWGELPKYWAYRRVCLSCPSFDCSQLYSTLQWPIFKFLLPGFQKEGSSFQGRK